MANKPKPADRLGIIERVTTPLGFFTLGILIVEGILGSLSIRATGINLTILIVGMLVGFAILCTMVFVLAIFPQFRDALLGATKFSPSGTIAKMNLTANDIRTIYIAHHNHGYLEEATTFRNLLGDTPLPWTQRVKKLQMLGLINVWPARYTHAGTTAAILTEEGKALGALIVQFSRPILEIQKSVHP